MPLLTDKYCNRGSIVHPHLKAIWNEPSTIADSATGLRKLLETTNENLRTLHELGQDFFELQPSNGVLAVRQNECGITQAVGAG